MNLPGKATMLALLDTLSMPFVLIAMGISACGCIAWALLVLVFVITGGIVQTGWMGAAIAAWTIAAAVLGFWNFGRFMAYFADAERKLTGLVRAVGVSIGLVATNPLLWYAWLAG